MTAWGEPIKPRSAVILFLFVTLVCSLLWACTKRQAGVPVLEEWYDSSLVDDLSGVWVYPADVRGQTTIMLVKGHDYVDYEYPGEGIELPRSSYRQGFIFGEQGVYFFPNEASFYSPTFLVRAGGTDVLIISRGAFENHVRDGCFDTQILVRVAKQLDARKAPRRPTMKELELRRRRK